MMTTIVFKRPFVCKSATAGFAHRIALNRPDPAGPDVIGRCRTVAGLCPSEITMRIRDELIGHPEFAHVIDEDAGDRRIPINDEIFAAIWKVNPEDVFNVIRAFAALLGIELDSAGRPVRFGR